VDRIRLLVYQMVVAVVDIGEEVEVEADQAELAVTYRVKVASSDLGKALGKNGRLANSMRVIAKASAARDGKRIYIEIEERKQA
jgi:uncharacterized protein